MGALPVDFEAKVKDPRQIGGGYPCSIKAKDLMANFVDAKLEVDESAHPCGLMLEQYLEFGENGHKGRKIRLNPYSSISASHPWQVTNAGSGKAAIAAGFVLGYFIECLGNGNFPSLTSPPTDDHVETSKIVLGFGGEYTGGDLAITGTQYIYVETERNGPTETYAGSREGGDVGVDAYLGDIIEPAAANTIALVASSSLPSAYIPTTGKAAVCIARVTNAAGTITVDKQYVTHNPTLFLPTIFVSTDELAG